MPGHVKYRLVMGSLQLVERGASLEGRFHQLIEALVDFVLNRERLPLVL